MSISDCLRHCLLNPTIEHTAPTQRLADEDIELRRRELAALNSIGNNLNQLARHANALRGATNRAETGLPIQMRDQNIAEDFDRHTEASDQTIPKCQAIRSKMDQSLFHRLSLPNMCWSYNLR